MMLTPAPAKEYIMYNVFSVLLTYNSTLLAAIVAVSKFQISMYYYWVMCCTKDDEC
jgi:hypothetical protein